MSTTTSTQHPVRVKFNFQNHDFSSIGQARDFLVNHCLDGHASIITRNAAGLNKVIFVSVDAHGVVRETYGNEGLINFEALQAAQSE